MFDRTRINLRAVLLFVAATLGIFSTARALGAPNPVPMFTDCNGNGIDDATDIAGATSADCNANAVPDSCDVAGGTSADCNANEVPDLCEVGLGPLQPTYPAPLNTNAGPGSGGNYAPQLTTDGSGKWVAVWSSGSDLGGTIGTDRDILFGQSTDNGATWTAPLPLNANAGSDSGPDYYPQLTTDGTGNWIAVWESRDGLGGTIGTDSDILFARSSDNGTTWSYPAPLNTNAGSDVEGDYAPEVATDGSGNWIVVWYSWDDLGGTIGTDTDILIARSTDSGTTWTDPVPLNANAVSDSSTDRYPRLTTDGLGTWLAVWESSYDLGGTIGTDLDIVLARSPDDGATWTYPTPLNSNAASDSKLDYHPQLTTDCSGKWVAVWASENDFSGTIGIDSDILYAQSTDSGVTWTNAEPLNANAGSDSEYDLRPQLTTDGSGDWVAVWESYDDLGGTIQGDPDILFTHSMDNGATWAYPDALNLNAASDLRYDYVPQLTTDDSGNWVAVWESYDYGQSRDILFARFRYGRQSDCNLNGIPDDCDADCDGNGVPDQCETPGDMNHDGYVDDEDVAQYVSCLTRPCGDESCWPALYGDECCAAADVDFDGDVDLHDFWTFQRMFKGV